MPKLTVTGEAEEVPEVDVNWTKWHQMPANQERVKATAAKRAGERDFSVLQEKCRGREMKKGRKKKN